MDISALEGLGFSQVEIKVFVTILELGESKAGKIIEKSGLQSSSVYDGINKLISKGFVSYIKKSKVKYYKAADPEAILGYIDLKKSEYLKILPELKEKQKKTEEEGVEFFKSTKGIKTILLQMFSEARKGDVCRFFSVLDREEYQKSRESVFRFTKAASKEKKVVMKGIFHENNRYAPDKYSITQKRYVDFPLPPNTLILGNKVAILSWEKEPKGILITSKDVAEKYSSFFEAIWKIGKK